MAQTELEALIFSMDVNLQKMLKKLDQANGNVSSSTKKMQKKFDEAGASIESRFGDAFEKVFNNSKMRILDTGAERISVFGSALEPLGPLGIAAAAGIGAFVFAVEQASKAMEWADQLEALADQIGVTAESLQALQYAAQQTDVSSDDLSKGLQALNASLGAVQSGVGAAKIEKAFAAIGISADQLKSMNDASELLPVLADRIDKVGSQAAQVQIAKKLGVEQLLPLLHAGADGIRGMTDQAANLGLVIDNDTVHSLAEMNKQVEVAHNRIDTQLKVAFVNLAPAIEGATTALANFLQFLNDPGGDGSKLVGVINEIERSSDAAARKALLAARVQGLKGRAAIDFVQKQIGAEFADPHSTVTAEDMERFAGIKKTDGLIPQPTGSAHTPPDVLAAAQRQNAQAEKDYLTAQTDLTQDIMQRAKLQKDALDIDLKAKMVAVANEEARNKKINPAQAEAANKQLEEALARQAIVTSLKKQAIDEKAKQEWIAKAAADAKQMSDLGNEQLSILASIAPTLKIRRDLEAQLLANKQQEERDDLERQIAAPDFTGDATGLRNALDIKQRAETRAQVQANEGPLRQYLDGFRDLDTLMQNAAVDGLQSLNEGIADLITNGGKAADVLHNVLNKVLNDVINSEIGSVERAGANFFKSIFGHADGRVPGYANGRTGMIVSGPGTGRSDSVLAQGDHGLLRVSDGEAIINAASTKKYGQLLKMINEDRLPGYAYGRFPAIPQGVLSRSAPSAAPASYYDLRGAVVTQDLLDQMNRIGQQSAAAGARLATTQVQKNFGAMADYHRKYQGR